MLAARVCGALFSIAHSFSSPLLPSRRYVPSFKGRSSVGEVSEVGEAAAALDDDDGWWYWCLPPSLSSFLFPSPLSVTDAARRRRRRRLPPLFHFYYYKAVEGGGERKEGKRPFARPSVPYRVVRCALRAWRKKERKKER